MIVRSGNAASFLVEFLLGPPDGDVDWSVLGPDGSVLDSGTVIVSDTSVSAIVPIAAPVNTLADELTSYRDVTWTYAVAGEVQNGEQRYIIEARAPFGASPDGVRNKLGVARHDLPDSEISLIAAYLAFTQLAAEPTGPYSDAEQLALRNAIEAMAALAVLPTMPVRIASQESSGTDTFKRQEIDWNTIGAELEGTLASGILVLVPSFDISAGFGAVFMLAPPAGDPITGTA